MSSLKKPEACESLNDIRTGIDSLDKEIIQLLSRRMGYVKAAAQFKPNEESIPAPERVVVMLEDRKNGQKTQEYQQSLLERYSLTSSIGTSTNKYITGVMKEGFQ